MYNMIIDIMCHARPARSLYLDIIGLHNVKVPRLIHSSKYLVMYQSHFVFTLFYDKIFK